MIIKSVNVGLPREIIWKGKKVSTAIYKYPTDQTLAVRQTNIDGDAQAEADIHGGIDKAVYSYSAEYYAYWENALQYPIETGAFGENITTQGLVDHEVHIGDEYRFGTAVLMAIQPRMPCYKLGIRFNNAKMVKYFYEARKNGIYFRVLKEGTVQKGDTISLIKHSKYAITIQDMVDNYVLKTKDIEKIHQMIAIPFMPAWFRSEFQKMLSAV